MTSRSPVLILGDGQQAAQWYLDYADDLDVEIAGFVQDHDVSSEPRELCGLPVYPVDQIAGLAKTHAVASVIGQGDQSRLVETVERMGFGSRTIVHPKAFVSPHAKVGTGTCISPLSAVMAGASVGRHVFMAWNSVVGHDSSVGDFTSIAAGCRIPGRVSIGRACFLGIGSVVVGGITIHDGAVVGAGAVVTRDVGPGVTVAGNPARPLKPGR